MSRWLDPRLVLLLLALIAAWLAYTNPMMDVPRHLYRYVFVVDISQSMNVQDMEVDGRPVSRLQFTRHALRESLSRLPCGSEAGFAMFTEHRVLLLFTPVEVCEHFSVLVETLERLDWRIGWAQRSEVMKGILSSLRMIGLLKREVQLVFITDGHEAPPIHADFRLPMTDYRGPRGLVLGVGGDEPVQIPKLNADGELMGYWRALDVQQLDAHTMGRSGSVENEGVQGVDNTALLERMAEGTEHLSSLRESHLRELAAEAGLVYVRATSPAQVERTLRKRDFAYRTQARTAVHWALALLAALCLLMAAVSKIPSRPIS